MIEIEEKTRMSRREDLIEAVILVQKHLEILTDIVTFCGRKGVSWLRSDGILSITSDGFKKRPTLRLANFARKPVAPGASRRGHLRGAREGASAAHHRLIIMRGTVGELDRMHGGAAAQYALPG